MTLIAVPFAVTTGRRGALYGIGVGIVLAIVYWLTINVFGGDRYRGHAAAAARGVGAEPPLRGRRGVSAADRPHLIDAPPRVRACTSSIHTVPLLPGGVLRRIDDEEQPNRPTQRRDVGPRWPTGGMSANGTVTRAGRRVDDDPIAASARRVGARSWTDTRIGRSAPRGNVSRVHLPGVPGPTGVTSAAYCPAGRRPPGRYASAAALPTRGWCDIDRRAPRDSRRPVLHRVHPSSPASKHRRPSAPEARRPAAVGSVGPTQIGLPTIQGTGRRAGRRRRRAPRRDTRPARPPARA